MLRRISVMCLLMMCAYVSICDAYSSGVTENRTKDIEHNTYSHSYYVTVDFSHLYPKTNILCKFVKNFEICDFEESIGEYINIDIRKTSTTHTLYYPRKLELSTDDMNYLTLYSPTYEKRKGEVKEEYVNATFYIFRKDFATLKRLFNRRDTNIKMRVYDVNDNYYDYIFNIEQMDDIRNILFA